MNGRRKGYPRKQAHSEFPFLLQNPQTDLEKAMAKIEQALAKERDFWHVKSYQYNRAILEVPEKQVIAILKRVGNCLLSTSLS